MGSSDNKCSQCGNKLGWANRNSWFVCKNCGYGYCHNCGKNSCPRCGGKTRRD